MAADRRKCGICQFALDGTETEDALLCGHTYHRYCIEKYATHKMSSLENLECPVCKQTGSQINAMVQLAFGEDGAEPAANDTVLEVPDDDIPVPVPVPAGAAADPNTVPEAPEEGDAPTIAARRASRRRAPRARTRHPHRHPRRHPHRHPHPPPAPATRTAHACIDLLISMVHS